jgi:prophage DNA circulation protein
MIFIGSRYETEQVQYLLDARTETTRPSVLRSPQIDTPESTSFTEWNTAYRLDQVADRLYQDAERWWRIMDRNPEILNPWSVSSGTRVSLP